MSMYRGVIRKYGVKYNKCGVGKATNKDGVTACPYCQRSDGLTFDGEHCQIGLFARNQYQEFYSCANCLKRFVIVMMRTEEDYFA